MEQALTMRCGPDQGVVEECSGSRRSDVRRETMRVLAPTLMETAFTELIAAMLTEQNDEWAMADRRYFDADFNASADLAAPDDGPRLTDGDGKRRRGAVAMGNREPVFQRA